MVSRSTTYRASPSEIEQELVAALQSHAFRSAPKLGTLLRYLCAKALADEGERVTEYLIAVDVLGKPENFKDSKDSNVRVEVYRLRKKLAQFYETEGAGRPLRIIIRPGQYTPDIVRVGEQDTHHDEERAVEQVAQLPEAPSERHPADVLSTSSAESNRSVITASSIWLGIGVLCLLVVIALIVIALLVARRPQTKTQVKSMGLVAQSESRPTQSTAQSNISSSGFAAVPLRIAAGYSGEPILDGAGNVWRADQYFKGGRPYDWGSIRVWRTNTQALFRHSRIGEVSYEIPLKPGVYELHLYFVEPEYTPEVHRGEGDRTFLIHVNSDRLLPPVDIESDAMGANIADERIIRDVQPASDGLLHLWFETSLGVPILNALEILPGTPHHQLPIRVVARPSPFTDHLGQVWQSDNFFLNGQTVPRDQVVAGTRDPGLFGVERYGHFTYAIPVDQRGRYGLTLHFAEMYFGSSGANGLGRRVFNVMCNGLLLLDDIDVFKEVGYGKALTKSFHNLKPSAQGKLNLTFEPVNNYALVSALEVTDESQ